jgi:hypothetical protein
VLVALAALGGRSGQADDTGFKPLFNRKDLSGWVTPDDKSLFSVENGVIVGRTRGDLDKDEYLVTDRIYGDFDLKVKVRLKVKAKLRDHNSGINFRSKRTRDGAMLGPQVGIGEGYWGTLYGLQGQGALDRDRSYVEKLKRLVRRDDWNEYEIIARGNGVVILLNGVKVAEGSDARKSQEKLQGVIALQLHIGSPMEVRFKDLLIKPLGGPVQAPPGTPPSQVEKRIRRSPMQKGRRTGP